MKKSIITSLFAALVAANVNAQTDTLVISQPEKVKVITKDDTLSISIEGEKDNPAYFFNKTVVVDSEKDELTTTSKDVGSHLGWDFSLLEGNATTSEIVLSLKAQLYVGWNILMNTTTDMKLKGFSSYEAGIDIFHLSYYPRSNRWWLSADWGIVLSRYYFKDRMMTAASDGITAMSMFPNGSSSQSSLLQTLGGNLTLIGHHRLAKEHSVGLGVTWSEKVMDNCYYKSKYTLSDGSSITDMNEAPIRSNLFSIKAEYMFADQIGLYLRYSPMSVLKTEKAPGFKQINVGFQVRF